MTDLPPLAALTPRWKVWFEHDGQVALSDWRVDLLEAIEASGSLAEAARRLDVPYKTAWYKLREVEEGLGVAVLATATGGAKGGSASLTPEGKEILRRYHEVVDGIEELVAERFRLAFS
jgi:molybdate transport system regulatory protein